jgi:hypothetical protein
LSDRDRRRTTSERCDTRGFCTGIGVPWIRKRVRCNQSSAGCLRGSILVVLVSACWWEEMYA